jgi:hypothetical protein
LGNTYKREYYNSKLNIEESELSLIRNEEPLITFQGLTPSSTSKLPELRPVHNFDEVNFFIILFFNIEGIFLKD